MNPKIISAAVLLFLNLLLFSPDSSGKSNNYSSKQGNIEDVIQASPMDYSYVKVFADGSWWWYVYEDGILIDRYPAEE